MSMSKYFICCEPCFHTIGRKDTKAARLWMDLCAMRCESEIVFLRGQDFPALQTLESLGFLITTDHSKGIAVKMIGCMETEDGEPFFCSKGGYHNDQ